MSDFLSSFDKKNYDKTLSERDHAKELEQTKKVTKVVEPENHVKEKSPQQEWQAQQQAQYAEEAKAQIAENQENARETRPQFDAFSYGEDELAGSYEADSTGFEAESTGFEPEVADTEEATEMTERPKAPIVQKRRESHEEETEVDPTYQKRRRNKLIIMIVLAILVIMAGLFGYYKMTHVKMPDFVGKQVSEARKWATENKITADIKQEYSMEEEANGILKQSTAKNKDVKKGSTVSFVTSLGPDPDAKIPFPDFATMTESAANEWVSKNKAENLSVMKEYSDTVEKGKFIRQEISDKEITPETYRRKDRAIVYFSKGKETFEKNIAVPDFTNKAKTEVETWAKSNSITMAYEEADSDTVEAGMVISQSIAKDTKVAKKDEMKVVISLGKAVIVPNFADFTPETAATAAEGLIVTVKTEYGNAAYGQVLSQSVAAGTKLNLKDTKNVTVVYSLGQPYLKSVIGSLEGDLPSTFYNDYQSKGANIRYTTYAVNSDQIRGTVVEMSAYNQYVGLNYTVSIGISNGALYNPNAVDPAPSPAPGTSGSDQT